MLFSREALASSKATTTSGSPSVPPVLRLPCRTRGKLPRPSCRSCSRSLSRRPVQQGGRRRAWIHGRPVDVACVPAPAVRRTLDRQSPLARHTSSYLSACLSQPPSRQVRPPLSTVRLGDRRAWTRPDRDPCETPPTSCTGPADRSASGRWAVDKIGPLVAELRTSAQVRSPFAWPHHEPCSGEKRRVDNWVAFPRLRVALATALT